MNQTNFSPSHRALFPSRQYLHSYTTTCITHPSIYWRSCWTLRLLLILGEALSVLYFWFTMLSIIHFNTLAKSCRKSALWRQNSSNMLSMKKIFSSVPSLPSLYIFMTTFKIGEMSILSWITCLEASYFMCSTNCLRGSFLPSKLALLLVRPSQLKLIYLESVCHKNLALKLGGKRRKKKRFFYWGEGEGGGREKETTS